MAISVFLCCHHILLNPSILVVEYVENHQFFPHAILRDPLIYKDLAHVTAIYLMFNPTTGPSSKWRTAL